MERGTGEGGEEMKEEKGRGERKERDIGEVRGFHDLTPLYISSLSINKHSPYTYSVHKHPARPNENVELCMSIGCDNDSCGSCPMVYNVYAAVDCQRTNVSCLSQDKHHPSEPPARR